MIDLIVFMVGCLGSGIAGYGLRALKHPAPKRGKNGLFIKN